MADLPDRIKKLKEIRKKAKWIQRVGAHGAKPAREVETGEEMVFNGGSTEEVTAILKETKKTIVFELDGQYERRKKKDTLVAIDGMGVYSGVTKDELQNPLF